MIPIRALRPRAAALAGALLCFGACTDLPTGTDSFQLEADGQLWVAIVPQGDLPDAATWLAYGPVGAEGDRLRVVVQGRWEEARRARGAGDEARAQRLLEEALQEAAGAMTVAPGASYFLAREAALLAWESRARAAVALERAPALATTLESVERHREAMAQAVTEGDYRTAAIRLTEASELARSWSPDGVALQVLDRVETHLAAAARSPEERERTAQLVASARQELVGGSPLRAMQRALYALQLAGGSELREIPAETRPSCGEYAC